MYTNQSFFANLEAAIKGTTDVATLGTAVLQPEKLARFVRKAELAATILPTARLIEMDAQEVDIDRIGFLGRVLQGGQDATGAHIDIAGGSEVEPTIESNKLTARELQVVVKLQDKALRRSIERGNFENTIIDLIGEAAGRDLEEYALLADQNITFGEDNMLSLTNGWAQQSVQRVYGGTTTGSPTPDFDPLDATFPVNMFQAARNALPKKYLQNTAEWAFYCPDRIYDAYTDIVANRQTALGDNALTNGGDIRWKNHRVVYAPTIERSADLPDALDATVGRDRIEGEVVLFANARRNLAWGVFHTVTIEPNRLPRERATEFVLTIEADAGYEDENAAVTILVDKAATA